MSGLRASVTMCPRREDVPRIEHRAIVLGDLILMLPVESAEAAAWCRDFALVLQGQAELLDIKGRVAERDISSVVAMIAEARRDNGEIADDGWCWDCKADNHDKHRTWVKGWCPGCSCTDRATQPHGTDRAPDTERSESDD